MAVLEATQRALDRGGLNLSPRGHIAETLLDVGGVEMHVIGGRIVDGEVQSINASRRDVR